MMTAIERLQELTVRDVMAAMVVQVAERQTMGEVSQVMHKHHVSLVPVVDEQGRARGVISAFDFVIRESRREAASGAESSVGESGLHQPAAAHMTAPVRSVDEHAPLLEAARLMFDEHLHRLLVLDGQGRPRGVISTMDVISAVLNAIDEMRSAPAASAR